MREIKFRGKELVNNEWVYGYLLKIDGNYHILNETDMYEDGHHVRQESDKPTWVKPETVGQFTGLHDKNGKEVYEGDIVNRIDIALKRNHIGKVVYSEQTASFYLEVDNGTYTTMERFVKQESFNDGKAVISCKYEYEVLGNVYDNKELLKGG